MSYHGNLPVDFTQPPSEAFLEQMATCVKYNLKARGFSTLTPFDEVCWMLMQMFWAWQQAGQPPFKQWFDQQWNDPEANEGLPPKEPDSDAKEQNIKTLILETHKRVFGQEMQ